MVGLIHFIVSPREPRRVRLALTPRWPPAICYSCFPEGGLYRGERKIVFFGVSVLGDAKGRQRHGIVLRSGRSPRHGGEQEAEDRSSTARMGVRRRCPSRPILCSTGGSFEATRMRPRSSRRRGERQIQSEDAAGHSAVPRGAGRTVRSMRSSHGRQSLWRRKHMDIQTDNYLEELTDRRPRLTRRRQTDAYMDAPSPSSSPRKPATIKPPRSRTISSL